MTKKGQDMGGVRDFEDLRQRSVIAGETGCWIVRAAESKGSVYLWSPDIGRVISLAALVAVLQRGRLAKPGTIWRPICGDRRCGNPAHRKLGTMAEYRKASRPELSPAHRQRIAQGMRARPGSKYTPELRAEILASDEEPRVMAERLGLHHSTIQKVRAGLLWRDAAPGASVFHLAQSVLRGAA